MPILVMAVMALVVFGAIGVLLFVASQMEKNTENAHHEHRATRASSLHH